MKINVFLKYEVNKFFLSVQSKISLVFTGPRCLWGPVYGYLLFLFVGLGSSPRHSDEMYKGIKSGRWYNTSSRMAILPDSICNSSEVLVPK